MFNTTCGGGVCHSGATAAGGLDLTSPGVISRLVDQPAQFPGVDPDAGLCPTSKKLIDTEDRAASWMLLKVVGPIGACGALVPSVGVLSSTQLACLQAWVNSVPAER